MPDEQKSLGEQPKPLGEIELGLSVAQATAIVQEFDALWLAAAFYGKKKQKELLRLRNTLEEAVKTR
ncbi:MAG: hypothetical protein NTAFB01_13110 [Nitrospira sp.]